MEVVVRLCVAGASLSQGQVQISFQAQPFTGSVSDFFSQGHVVAGAALRKVYAQISWQAHHFHKVMSCRFGGRRSTFATDRYSVY